MGGELPRGPAAVADGVLLPRTELGHRPVFPGPDVLGDEARVVTESAAAPRPLGEPPLAAPLEQLLLPVGADQGDHADVGDPPILPPIDFIEQLGEVLL